MHLYKTMYTDLTDMLKSLEMEKSHLKEELGVNIYNLQVYKS